MFVAFVADCGSSWQVAGTKKRVQVVDGVDDFFSCRAFQYFLQNNEEERKVVQWYLFIKSPINPHKGDEPMEYFTIEFSLLIIILTRMERKKKPRCDRHLRRLFRSRHLPRRATDATNSPRCLRPACDETYMHISRYVYHSCCHRVMHIGGTAQK